MFNKQELILTFKDESAITYKVLRAVPADKLEFSPHEKSSSIKQLIKTFMADMVICKSFAHGEVPTDFYQGIQDFSSIEEGVQQLEKFTADFITVLETMSDDDLLQEFSAWGRTLPKGAFLTWLLFDHIHHRGQMSVYVRLAGGLVPSIYGPSADEEWKG